MTRNIVEFFDPDVYDLTGFNVTGEITISTCKDQICMRTTEPVDPRTLLAIMASVDIENGNVIPTLKRTDTISDKGVVMTRFFRNNINDTVALIINGKTTGIGFITAAEIVKMAASLNPENSEFFTKTPAEIRKVLKKEIQLVDSDCNIL